jgi:cytidine deaminase
MFKENGEIEFAELDDNDRTLVERTKALIRERKSRISTVSAGVRTSKGTEYFGLDVDSELSTEGMCAEFSAIGAMVTGGERNLHTIVAVCHDGGEKYSVIPPCGRCRELLKIFGNPNVIVPLGRNTSDLKKVELSDLLPLDWSSRL